MGSLDFGSGRCTTDDASRLFAVKRKKAAGGDASHCRAARIVPAINDTTNAAIDATP
jgi:hypothetical protein